MTIRGVVVAVIAKFDGPPSWFLVASDSCGEGWGGKGAKSASGDEDWVTAWRWQISLALRNQDDGPLNSAIDLDNNTEK